jgi:hypothetical protein
MSETLKNNHVCWIYKYLCKSKKHLSIVRQNYGPDRPLILKETFFKMLNKIYRVSSYSFEVVTTDKVVCSNTSFTDKIIQNMSNGVFLAAVT